MKLAIVIGTRPEIIKMAPIIKECIRSDTDYFIIHTGQHYSFEMDRIFFDQISLPEPDYKLEVGSDTHAAQTAKIMMRAEEVIRKSRPDFVLVEGDTNTVLASAIAATKLHVKVGHLEAGLRSHDKTMPEEINRILTDHCSDILFAPTEYNRRTLHKERLPPENIFVTGNTIVDALHQNLEISKHRSDILEKLGLYQNDYFLVTLHRQENVDNPKRFKNIISALELLPERFNSPVIYPIHPRSEKMLHEFNITFRNIKFTGPLDYFSFLQLEKNAKLILTDSGGVQEEACIMKVPCVTLRDNTERQETIEIGANTIAGTTPAKISRSVETMLAKSRTWCNPFGDGRASSKILRILNNFN
ncbi:MAG: UDP-N-acetylglucosamine 2-epimerase (non-hydrolyzing) [Thermoproteota archaeon]|nr:UDP-N-acetylglucosamine 2-epimerase (non-hydrolyzing) [Thermoproteota archaeon]